VIAGVLRGGSLAVHSVILTAIGAVLFACGIALAVWARLHLGRNWGMPMTQRAEPELVTSGPYRFVRHPIYSGLLTAMLGDRAGRQPARPDRRRGAGRVLLCLRDRRGA
jgi:protein-S-isoprenylcysteine O-methyltransferase Ste14